MAQQLSPWLEGAYGWNFGEGGWNTGMDQNLLKFSFMFDRNVDSIVASLPPAVNGEAHYNTADNRLYFAVGTTYFSTPVPKWFTVVVRSTGATWQYNGATLDQVESPIELDTRLDAVELTVASLGSAAFEDVSAFATAAELDVVEGQSQAYTDVLRTDLAGSGGADLLGFIHTDLSAVIRTAAEKMGDTVSVLDFMTQAERDDTKLAVPLLDHTAAFQAALNYTGRVGQSPQTFGSRLILPGARRYNIASITVPKGVVFSGESESMVDMYTGAFTNSTARILLAEAATISIDIGAVICGITIVKQGMTFPQNAAQAAAWTGTAITCLGSESSTIHDTVVIGFNLGISALVQSRLRLRDVLIDCRNGVDHSGSLDISYLTRVHCWPMASQGLTSADNIRNGVGVYLHDTVDWAKLTDCFVYGYSRCYKFENVGAVTALSCGADGVTGNPSHRGFSIEGTAGEIRLIAPQVAAQGVGLYINTTPDGSPTRSVYVMTPNMWACESRNIQIDSGTGLYVYGGQLRGAPDGITINDAAAYGVIRDVTFGADITGSGVQHVIPNDNFRVSGCSLVDSAAGKIETLSKTAPVVASAATLVLNQYHDVLTVSGTAGITAISSVRRSVGSVVVLRFSSGLTLTNSASLVLRGGVDATPGANDIMTFAYFGNGTWRETARNF